MKKTALLLVILLTSAALLGCKAEDLGIGKSALGGQSTPTTTGPTAPTQNRTVTSDTAASNTAQTTGKVEATDFANGKVKLLPPGFPGLTSDCSRSGLYTLQITGKCKWWDVPAAAYKTVWGTWKYSQEAAFWLAIWGGIETSIDPDEATNTYICLAPPGTDIYPYLAGILEKIMANANNYGGWAGRIKTNLSKPNWVSQYFPEYEQTKAYLARGDKK